MGSCQIVSGSWSKHLHVHLLRLHLIFPSGLVHRELVHNASREVCVDELMPQFEEGKGHKLYEAWRDEGKRTCE